MNKTTLTMLTLVAIISIVALECFSQFCSGKPHSQHQHSHPAASSRLVSR